ncbi:unnamed protein product [Urochloa decumbens]|uniref:Uncharacterized protein n=1 Tax=Urochloa decumbens TaxID=240449 RepID=A0ABC9D3D9_9POAL
MEPAGRPEKPQNGHPEATTRAVDEAAPPWSWLAGLVAVGLGGAALLVWWALAFHPANARLWMVPAGLVLLGTPVMAWLSLLASGPRGRQASPPGAAAYTSA